MNKWTFLLLVVLCGCFSRSAYISQEKFNNVQVGETVSTLVKQVGEPYSVRNNSSGEQVYEYVESINTGNRLLYENHYFFIVKNGQVVGKRFSQEQEPPYDMIYQDDPNHHYYP